MASDWYDDWKADWGADWWLMAIALEGYFRSWEPWKFLDRAAYGALFEISVDLIADDVKLLGLHYAYEAAGVVTAWVSGELGDKGEEKKTVWEIIFEIVDAIASIWSKFGYTLGTGDYTVETWVAEKIAEAKVDLTLIWDTFGANLIAGKYTVETWVAEKIEDAKQWARDKYDDAKTKANDSWTWITTTGYSTAEWIATTGKTAADWVEKYGASLANWKDKYIDFYIFIHDHYKNDILNILYFPDYWVIRHVREWLEGTEEVEGQSWFLSLLKFLLRPIGWLLDWLDKGWDTFLAWILGKIDKWTASQEEWEEHQRSLIFELPNLAVYAEGLFNPGTLEEREALEDTLQQIKWVFAEELGDHPPVFPIIPLPDLED